MFRSGKDPLLLSGVSVEMLIMQTGCLAVQNAVTAWEGLQVTARQHPCCCRFALTAALAVVNILLSFASTWGP